MSPYFSSNSDHVGKPRSSLLDDAGTTISFSFFALSKGEVNTITPVLDLMGITIGAIDPAVEVVT